MPIARIDTRSASNQPSAQPVSPEGGAAEALSLDLRPSGSHSSSFVNVSSQKEGNYVTKGRDQPQNSEGPVDNLAHTGSAVKPGESTQRYLKRARTSNAWAALNSSSGRSSVMSPDSPTGQKTSPKFLSVPKNLLYEIFSYLVPADILSLVYTSKHLHGLLASCQSCPVWKNARINGGIPEPTHDLTELRWATLLFGDFKCEMCDARDFPNVDFGLRRRICDRCRKKYLGAFSQFTSAFPDLKADVLDFVTYTDTDGSSSSRTRRPTGKFYWKPDVIEVGKVWTSLLEDISAGTPCAEQRLDEFETSRIRMVHDAMKNVEKYNDWYSRLPVEHWSSQPHAQENQRDQIFERFRQLGYDDQDISCIKDRPEIQQGRELSDRHWGHIIHVLEPIIKNEATKCVFKERRRLVTALLEAYLKRLSPNAWILHPSTQQLLEMPELKTFLKPKEQDAMLKSRFLTDIVPILPSITENWKDNRREDLRGALRQDPFPLYLSPDIDQDILDLALSIFECDDRDCLGARISLEWGDIWHPCSFSETVPFYGWEEAQFHLQHRLKVHTEALLTARSIVRLARFDSRKVTLKQMDESGVWFWCKSCTPELYDGCAVYTWRAAISHTLGSTHLSRPKNVKTKIALEPVWKVLPSVEAEFVTGKDHDMSTLTSRCWSCNRCHANFGTYVKWNVVQKHMKAIHQIEEPVAGVDVISCPSHEERRHFVYQRPGGTGTVAAQGNTALNASSQSGHNIYRCMVCKPGNRRFQSNGVQAHIKAKHGVDSPTQEVHFTVA